MKQFMATTGKMIVSVLKVVGAIFYNDAYEHYHNMRPYPPRKWD